MDNRTQLSVDEETKRLTQQMAAGQGGRQIIVVDSLLNRLTRRLTN